MRWIFFDLDGTLADSLPVMEEIYRGFLSHYGAQGTKEEFDSLNGPSIQEFIPILKEAHGLPGLVESLVAEYQARLDDAYRTQIQPRAGAAELLSTLVREGHSLMLVTSGRRSSASAFIDQQGWSDFFKGFVFGDEVQGAKPEPDIYRLATDRAGLKGRLPIAVEDSVNGVRSARTAGAYVVALAGHHAPEVLRKAGADRVISSLGELGQMIPLLSGDAEVVEKGPVDVSWTDEEWQPDKAEDVERHWQEHPRRSAGTVFDDPLLSVDRIEQVQGRCQLIGRYVGYKYYFIQREYPLLHQGIRPVGVSGITVLDEGGPCYVLIARRSASVTAYQGWLELVPSGSLDVAAKRTDGSVDVAAALLTEFAEETGLDASLVRSVDPLALVFDTVDGVYDVGCRILLDSTSPSVRVLTQTPGEYQDLEWVPLPDLRQFVAAHRDELVPPSRALLSCLDILDALRADGRKRRHGR